MTALVYAPTSQDSTEPSLEAGGPPVVYNHALAGHFCSMPLNSLEVPMRFPRTFLAVVSLLALAALTAPPAGAGDSTSSMLGKAIEDFTLTDFSGEKHSLAQHHGGKGTVLIFVSTRCPVSNAYNERMVELAGEYQPKGFQFLGINANKAEEPAELASHAKENDWNFPVLKDTGNVVADQLNAAVTPEVFLLDGQGVLRYHGRIDDSQDPSGIKSRDLEAAMDAMLAGKEIPQPEAKAFGCSIKRVDKAGMQGE